MKTTSKTRKKGIVAVSTLWISIVLLILIVALLGALRTEHGHVLRFNQNSEALYIAEAGFAAATLEMSRDNTWSPTDPIEYVFPTGGGKYRIAFDSDGVVGPDESVNNLAKSHAVDGPRGVGTVPPHMTDLVVVVELRGRKIRYEALISRGFSAPVTVPLLASGNIAMEGDLTISGVESLVKPVSVPAGVHSNKREDEAGIITWKKTGGAQAFVSGEVSTSSTNTGSISASAGFNALDVESGRPPMRFPIIDVETAVRNQDELKVLVPASPGNQTVVAGQDQRFSGGKINGDLVLQGVNLYVQGDLEVNGSITGSGSIYVDGNTTFKGSTELKMVEDKALALFSRGHVKLEGFDGTQFLDSLATSSTDFNSWNEAAKDAHADIKAIVSDITTYGTTWGNAGTTNNDLNDLRAILGGGAVPPPPPPDPPDPSLPPIPDPIEDALGEMASHIETNYPAHESTKFLVERLRTVRQLYAPKPGAASANSILNNFKNGNKNYTGLLDVLNRGNFESQADLANRGVGFHNFDKLGTAYFQGVIYTNGALYAANEVQIVGALLSQKSIDSPSASLVVPNNPAKPNPENKDIILASGDVSLLGGSSIVFNKGLLENPFVGSPSGPVMIQSWLGEKN